VLVFGLLCVRRRITSIYSVFYVVIINCVCKAGAGKRPVICTSYTSHCSASFTVNHDWHSRMESRPHRGNALGLVPDSMSVSATFWGQISLLLCQVAMYFSVLNTIGLCECWIFYCLSSVIENFYLLWTVLVLLVSSSTNDTSAYINLARVFAQRCLESGISEVRCDLKPLPGGKVSWKWPQKHSL